MYKVTKFPHGTFSWADTMSTDADKAKEFYVQLFGWEKEEVPIGEGTTYTMFKQDGADVGALSPMPKDMQEQNIPSHWMNYITVDDVDALVEKVKDNGGTVLSGPFDVFDNGRMMTIQDPTGATVSLWQAKNSIGAGMVNAPGAMLWNELATRDVDKAKDFYSKLLGWEFGVDDDSGYIYIRNNGRMNGGLMEMDEKWGDVPPHWMVYYNVADIDAAIKKVEALGGKIHLPKTEAPGVGPFSVVADPAGAVFTIMQAEQYEAWKE